MEYSFFRRKFAGLDAIVCPGDPDDPVIIFCHGYGADADNLAFFPSACPFKECALHGYFLMGLNSFPMNLAEEELGFL
ncbi:lysophospholipase esterase [Chlamydia felis Fe/C-56]|uniref:Lysophospholipase esterase n=1 Tax=Chlamydia felis (strain Fe/C-56) TaxID=264202 RepID=Q254L9_CHLFF|nr:lysophospholipase esterase [Chlamydia felis Fe/C-56]